LRSCSRNIVPAGAVCKLEWWLGVQSRLPVCCENVRIGTAISPSGESRPRLMRGVDISRREEPRKKQKTEPPSGLIGTEKAPESWVLVSCDTKIGSRGARPGGSGFPQFHPHDSLHMTPKYESAILDIHRQIRRLVYTQSSGSNLRFNSTEEVSNGNAGASC
jgi:hypothetical protein